MKWLARILRGESAARAPASGDPARVAEAERALERLAPLLAADGGDVRLVAVEGDEVLLEWRGACRGCGAQGDTLRAGIEPALRLELAWLRGVRTTG